MSDQRNYSALDWVLGEIEQTLNDARAALESYVDNPQDSSHLRFCVTHIHQVRGSLQIVEFTGASLLAEEMEQLAQDLADRKIKKPDEAQEVLMRALLQLPIYLDHVRSRREDSTRPIMPLLNDIRAVRNKNYLTETSLFNPDLSSLNNISGERHLLLSDAERVRQVTSKLREMYQFSAASVLRNIKVRENLDYLQKVFIRLIALTQGTRSEPLWEIASALIEGIKSEHVELSVAVQGLLRHLARELRLLAEHAPESFDSIPREELIKNLLYYIDSSSANTPEIRMIRERFGLSEPDQGGDSPPRDGYSVRSLEPDAIHSVVIALREELKSIKTILEDIVSERQPPSSLNEVQSVVKRVADTLAVLGISELRTKMLLQAEQLEALAERPSVDESTIVDSVQHIIDVDTKLEAIAKSANTDVDFNNINERKIEITEAKLAVIRESQLGLEKAKDAIIEYVSSNWDRSHLENTDTLLHNIRGGLDIVPLPRAGSIVQACATFISDKLMAETEEPNWQTLEHLADAMASVEYFLERLSKDMNNEDAESLLDIAEESVSKLGFRPFDQDAEGLAAPSDTGEDVSESSVAQSSGQGTEEALDHSALNTEMSDELGDEDVIDEEILDIFNEEGREVIDTLNRSVPDWVAHPEAEDALMVVRRSFHTLKGSGRMVEASDISELAWAVENMLNRVLDDSVACMPEHQRLVQKVLGILPAMMDAFAQRVRYHDLALVERLSAFAFSMAEGKVPEDFNTGISATASDQEMSDNDDLAFEAPDQGGAEQEGAEQEGAANIVDDEYDSVLLDIFVSEANTHLQQVRVFLEDMNAAAPIYTPPTDEVQRALHTLKGSAKMAHILPMGQMHEVLESFAKELITFQVAVNDDILQLIRDAELYSNTIIDQITRRESIHLEQLDQFLARTAELREKSVGHLVRTNELQQDGQRPVDPQLLSIFMAEEMSLLLDAEEFVDDWSASSDGGVSPRAVCKELNSLAQAADHANLPDMMQMSNRLKQIYELLSDNRALIDARAVSHLKAGHSALLDMVDAVAAGQNVVPPPAELSADMQAYLDELTHLSARQVESSSEAEPAGQDHEAIFEAPGSEELEGDQPTDYSLSDPLSDQPNDQLSDQSDSDSSSELNAELAADDPNAVDLSRYKNFDEIDTDSDDYDADILDVFIDESDELIESLDEAIHAWEDDQDSTQVEEMKRALHTMKGGARLSGLPILGDLVHDYETFLIHMDPNNVDDSVRANVHRYQDQLLLGVNSVKDFLGRATDSAGDDLLSQEVERVDASEHDEQAPAAAEQDAEVPESTNVVPIGSAPRAPATDVPDTDGVGPETGVVKAFQPKRGNAQEVVRVNSDLLEELVNLAGETSISRARLEEQVGDFRSSLNEVDSTIARLQEQLRRLDIETEAQILFRQEQMAVQDESFDPLEMDRYSQLQQLSRSLVESASDLSDLRSDLSDKLKDAETTLLQQSRVNTTLQEGLMRSRMVPFSRMVPRLRRIVRQVASELGKKVSFELDNVEGELDRSVLERMVPPFEHMLRNAVDHGIEAPEDRIDMGKPETGRIVLTLGREGGNVVIRLADDGRGIDLGRVRRKAIERGLMDENADLSNHDIMQFILHAGFSTAENVTQISGRGVGMDVVHAEIKQLGGDVTIDSEQGKGTEFVIRLPFTLSVNRALMVNIGQDSYAIPLNTIEGIVRISPFELEHYYANPDSEFEYANDLYQVRYLGSLLYPGKRANLEGHVLPMPIVLVRSGQHLMALQVDGLMGSREIVVKNLGAQFAAVQGLSGATIMGDGRVVIILDPHALVRQGVAKTDLLEGAAQAESARLAQLADESAHVERAKTVIVVDDSVTVRKVTTRLLEREGFDVITAKDGVEALQVLQDETPDIMLLDIEMPRMDGFELAKNLRSSQQWKALPIIMITSRTGQKHRDHAASLGVNNYMGKPFQEEALIDNIRELVDDEVTA